jgi:cysteine desulfurase
MNLYFDFNATTPLRPVSRDAWLRANEAHWHNPSSLYHKAAEAKHALEQAREELGDMLGCEPERIVFTSGATESNNALFARLGGNLSKDKRVLSSAIEHPSVREPLQRWFPNRVSSVRTTATGEMDLEDLAAQLARNNVALMTAMAANNECGLLHPWRAIAEQCHEAGVLFHTDAAQWIGKEPSDELGVCNYITGCAHKFGGPKGVGFLVMRDEREALSFFRGGPQEEGRRAGTENLAGVLAMVVALREAVAQQETAGLKQAASRDKFEKAMRALFPEMRIIGENAERLWNTSMFVLPQGDNRKWLARLSQREVAVSTGSACSAGHDGSSVVLEALGATPDEMRRVIRVSGGWETGEEEWCTLVAAFGDVGRDLGW